MTHTQNDRVLIAVTSPMSWIFYTGFIKHLRGHGFEPVLMSAPGPKLKAIAVDEGAATVPIALERDIAPLKDSFALWKIYRAIREIRPTIVDAGTPKAGLLVGLAAWLARVPCRVYSIHGLRLETATGAKHALLRLTEKAACSCAHRVLCLSNSLRNLLLEMKLVSQHKTIVPGKGGIGVDVQHFHPTRADDPEVIGLRRRLGIPATAPVIGFVGRFVKDKGIRNLVEAFRLLSEEFRDLHLLLVGDFEDGDPVDPEIREFIESAPRVVRPGFVADTAPYYGLMNVFVLPTYREGFGQVSLEAQASGIPVVTTTATGAVDSVIDGVTGLHVPVGDSASLAAATKKLLENPSLQSRLGHAGRQWMERDFRPEVLWQARVELYRETLAEHSRRQRQPRTKLAAKRALDLLVAMVALIVLAPLLAAVALAVRIFLGSPVLFRQIRPGYKARPFTCLKFRTMTDKRDRNGQLLSDADRLTPFGQFLRGTSLDELPELINVIRGEMSFVGPRPLLMQYLPLYSSEQAQRHEVKPGITGWAQIHGRNAIDWKARLALDKWYVDHWSLWLDLKIIAVTMGQVIARRGITQPGQATVEYFKGNSEGASA